MHYIICYSGGADSQVVLDIALKRFEDTEIIFCDTGIEFPETYATIAETEQYYGKEIKFLRAGKTFEEYLESFNGLYPSPSLRWCTDRLKTRPLIKYMNSLRRQGATVAEVDGIREDESKRRATRQKVEPRRNCKWNIHHLIFEMSKNEVFKYISKHSLPINPLYEMGYSRVSCWFCPFTPQAENERLEETHPELIKIADKWAEKYGNRFNPVIEDRHLNLTKMSGNRAEE